MARLLVAEHFVWDEYPGLRAGKLYAGKGEIAKRPRGRTHVVSTPDAVETLCGQPRSSFPNDFTEPVVLRAAELCDSCGLTSSSTQ